MKVLVFGNSGSGKSTYARALADRHGLVHLDLDTIVWQPGQLAVQRPADKIAASLQAFIAANPRWVVEGCYGELVEMAVGQCSELVFLNPGVETCLANNARRPWEPHKYASPEQQATLLDNLQRWVADYYRRDDAWSFRRHRQIFDAYAGEKAEYLAAPPTETNPAMSDVLELTCNLIRRRSVTPDDAGCLPLIAERLSRAGFQIEHLRHSEVDNLWATHGQRDAPGNHPTLALLGHTDVVPSGPEASWQSPPFEPTFRDGRLYGRGAADMKGAVAAMVVALERFVATHPDHRGRVGLLLTSDEEGVAIDGVRKVVEQFRGRGEQIDWCVVGEPSAKARLGDLIRVGRRGSLSATLTVRGVQGHVAYPDQALNPIHAFAPALAELTAEHWDDGNADFPPTSLQVSNLHAGTGANNVIPGELQALFNFRFSTASRAGDLRARAEAILRRHGLDFQVDWQLSGEPFLTPPGGLLRQTVVAVCRELCGIEPEQSTGGGTSDGRFVALLGTEVVELGPVNATIHKVDECVAVQDLEALPALYGAVCERLLG